MNLPEHKQKILALICAIGIIASLAYYINGNMRTLKVSAPVHVNIELDKRFAQNISIEAVLSGKKMLFHPSPTSAYENTLKNTVLYTEIKNRYPRVKDRDYSSFINSISLRVPSKQFAETLNSIYGISVFIGNKAFYFSQTNLLAIEGSEYDGFTLCLLPNLSYEKGAGLINWYGNLNLALRIAADFFTQPANFIITWLFILALVFIRREKLSQIYSTLLANDRKTEILLLLFMLAAAFLLRFDIYISRGSSWIDELYSGAIASNPNLPFTNTMGDPGNPPLYYILLRFWFMLFGWSEASGRLLSVLMGTFAIIPLYFFVKPFAGRKAAFLAILLFAISNNIISQPIRGYTLQLFLVSIAALRFLIFFKSQSVKNMIWYIIPSVLLVNNHYYGVLFVIVNFILYILLSLSEKSFTWKKSAKFLFANIIIAATFLPFFIHITFSDALLNQGFNTWITKPGFEFKSFFLCVILGGILYLYLRKKTVPKYFTNKQRFFIDYTFGAVCLIFAIAFLISIFRPILATKYYPLCIIPLVFAAVAATSVAVSNSGKNSVKLICAILIFSLLHTLYHEPPGNGEPDAVKEAIEYANADVSSYTKASVLNVEMMISNTLDFYKAKNLLIYSKDKQFDVVYIVPLHLTIDTMYGLLDEHGFNRENILKIHINDQKTVFKKFLVNGK
jgi:hypothetical protein